MLNKDFTIVIADDHPMLLNGLYDALVSNEYNVIGKAQNGTEALQLILELKPTLAILDIEMPFKTGFEVIKDIKEKNIPTKFIIQTLHKNLEYITLALSLKIEGYLLKEDPFTAIETCMEKVLNNESYFSDSIDSNGLLNATNEFRNLKLLTPSELVILKLIFLHVLVKSLINYVQDQLGILKTLPLLRVLDQLVDLVLYLKYPRGISSL